MDPIILSKLQVSDLCQVEQLMEETAQKLKDYEEVSEIIQELKSNESFNKFLESVSRIERLERQKRLLEKFRELEEISTECQKTKDPDRSYSLYEKLQNFTAASDYMEELRSTRVAYIKQELSSVFSNKLEKLLEDMGWPFQSRGEIIGMHPHFKELFLETFQRLANLDSLESSLDTLCKPIEKRITYHFFSDKESNRIEKPEWLFGYTLKCFSLHFEFCYSCLENDLLENLAYLKQFILNRLINKVKQRVQADLNQLVDLPEKNKLLLHYIDEVIKFDWNCQETFRFCPNLLELFTVPKVFELWQEIDIKYLQSEFFNIFTEDSWEAQWISGYKFNNIRSVLMLYNTLASRYSQIFNEEVRASLLQKLQNWLFPMVVQTHEDQFNNLKHSLLHIESNPELWKELSAKFSALNQNLVSLQQFLLTLDSEFPKLHLEINILKTEVIKKLVNLVMITVEDVIKDYTRRNAWFEPNQLKVKTVKKCIEKLKEATAPEVFAKVVNFTVQHTKEAFLKEMKGKKLKGLFDNLMTDLRSLFKVIPDKENTLEALQSSLEEICDFTK